MPMTSQYWAVGTAGLFSHHRRAVLEGSALSLNWAYLKSLFFPPSNKIFMAGNQVRHS